jgi:pimeloyl-ACP methyl ester carboxylesterase
MRKGYVDVPHGQLHYWTAGAGSILVCLHQASQDSTEYRALVPHLASHYQLIVFDLPGHGQSYDPPHEYGVPEYGDALMQAMAQLTSERFAVLGHHSGAVLALDMAARLKQRISHIILSGMSWRSAENTKELIAARAKRNVPVTEDGAFLSGMWRTYASLVGEGVPLDSVLEPYLVNQLMRLRPYDAHHAVLAWDKSAALKTVACPTLLLQGDKDVFVVGQDKLMELLPGAQRRVIPGAGAFTFRDRPAEAARLIQEFLAR